MKIKRLLTVTMVSVLLGSFFLHSPTFAYTDVNNNVDYFQAIAYITKLGITKGYSDDTFRPKNGITRAEFMKMAVLSKFKGKFEAKPEDCFSDVKKDQWFAGYICYAKNANIIAGYPDGSFKPANFINIAEASKMLVGIFEQQGSISEGKYWYSPFIEFLATNAYLPPSVQYLNQDLKRGEVAEMLWRMSEELHHQPSLKASTLENAYCQKSPQNLPSSINMETVRSTWLTWYNDVRQELKLTPYAANTQLERTASEWSELAEQRGYMDHKRPGQSAYYDYAIITAWFKNLGLTFKNDHGVTYTENIGWGVYKCASETDCTQGLIDGVRSTFNFFMSEKGKSYTAHYDSIVNPRFKEIGLGIAVDPAKKKYYLTVHYGTEITSQPLPVCGN